MGQSILTGLAMIAADELDCDWTKVRTEFAPADKVYINPRFGVQGTGGSSGTPTSWNPLRKASATARAMLLTAAAQKWGVNPSECSAENSTILHAPTKRRLTYGSLAEAAAKLPVPQNVPLKHSERVPLDRQVHEAARYPDQSEWQRAIRNRCAAAGHGLCGGRAMSGVRRKSGEFRCRESEGGSRREKCHSNFDGRRRRRRQHLDGDGGTPGARHSMGRRTERRTYERRHQQTTCRRCRAPRPGGAQRRRRRRGTRGRRHKI